MTTNTRYWTHFWNRRTLDQHNDKNKDAADYKLVHTAGNLFKKRGLDPEQCDNVVYCLSRNDEGNVILLARIQVKEFVEMHEAEDEYGDISGPKAEDHLKGEGTLFSLTREVPPSVLRELEFITKKNKITKITFQENDADKIDKQTLRMVRELTEESANMLDEIIEPSGIKRQLRRK